MLSNKSTVRKLAVQAAREHYAWHASAGCSTCSCYGWGVGLSREFAKLAVLIRRNLRQDRW